MRVTPVRGDAPSADAVVLEALSDVCAHSERFDRSLGLAPAERPRRERGEADAHEIRCAYGACFGEAHVRNKDFRSSCDESTITIKGPALAGVGRIRVRVPVRIGTRVPF